MKRLSGVATTALVLMTSWLTSCAEPADGDTTAAEDARVASYTSRVDAQREARALALDERNTVVELRQLDGEVLFEAHYRPGDEGGVEVAYTLYPSANDTSEAVSSALHLDLPELPSLEQAIDGAIMIHTQVESAVLGNYDNWGCDLLPGQWNWIGSCGSKGRCCDVHDACYRQNGCTASSWTSAPWSTCQLRCNAPVVACFIAQNPGPSQCCSLGNCGRPR